MIRIKLEYDKYNRSFKLLDRELGAILDEGIAYDLLLIVIDEFAAQRIGVNEKAQQQCRKQPQEVNPQAMRLRLFAPALRCCLL